MNASNSLACFHRGFASAELRGGVPGASEGRKRQQKGRRTRGMIEGGKEGEEVRSEGLKRNVGKGEERGGEGERERKEGV